MAKTKPAPVIPVFYPPAEYFEPLLQFEISGQPPRKSNSRQIVRNRKTGSPMIIKSRNALSYSDDFLRQVPGEVKLGLGSPKDPLFLLAEVYYKSNLPDLSVELVKDLLQKAGVISDDRYIKGELLFSRVNKNNPRTLITLFRLKDA